MDFLRCQLISVGRASLMRKTVKLRPRYYRKDYCYQLVLSAVCTTLGIAYTFAITSQGYSLHMFLEAKLAVFLLSCL